MPEKRLIALQFAETIATRAGVSVDQAKALLTAQAELAVEHADIGCTIPGLGRLEAIRTPQRSMLMRFGPDAGKEKIIPAKTKLKFSISRVLKDQVFGPRSSMPDLFQEIVLPDIRFFDGEVDAPDAIGLPEDMAGQAEGDGISLYVQRLDDLNVPSGRIVAADLMVGGGKPFTTALPPGAYPLALIIARLKNGDERIAFALLRFSQSPVVRWEQALTEGQTGSGYGVDSGTGSFSDAEAYGQVCDLQEKDEEFFDRILAEMKKTYKDTRDWTQFQTPAGSVAVFSSGYGDGAYPSYFGIDADGKPATLVTNFGVVDWMQLADA
jgi:nucleoid DNA-binding protein